MSSRIDKVAGRYRELTGKPFKKISEARLSTLQAIAEIELSIQELSQAKPLNQLQIQKMQSRLIAQKRKLAELRT